MQDPSTSMPSSTIFLIGMVGSMSGLLIGYNTAVIAPALEFITQDFALGAFMQGVAVSSVLLGGFIGALLAGALIPRTGERPTLFVTAILFIVGGVGSAYADSFVPWLVWRTICGLGVGAATMVGPLYVSETAPARMRGALVSTVQLMITIGILVSYLAGAAWTPAKAWQSMLLVGAAPGLLLLLVLLAVPESPRWYLLRGRREDAERAHLRLTAGRGEPLPAPEPVAARLRWQDLFTGRNLHGAGAGDRAVCLRQSERHRCDPLLCADDLRAGGLRRHLRADPGHGRDRHRERGRNDHRHGPDRPAGTAAVADRRPGAHGGEPASSSLSRLMVGQGAAWSNMVAVSCLGLFVLAFGVSLGPLPYVLMSELFPLALRGAGMGIASAAAWGVNVVVSLTFPVLVEAFGVALVFGFYGLISIAALAFVLAFVPETRGRSLELIEANLASGRAVRDLGMPLPARSRGG